MLILLMNELAWLPKQLDRTCHIAAKSIQARNFKRTHRRFQKLYPSWHHKVERPASVQLLPG